MEALVNKNDFVNLIAKIQNVVPTKPSIPILANVLLEAIDDQIIVTSSDLTISMRCFMDATVTEEGSIALPARRFFQLIRELTSSQIKISSGPNQIAEIQSGTSVFRLNGMSRAEFPNLPDLKTFPDITFTATSLRELLTKTAFAAAREDNRYMLNGVQLQVSNQRATFIGTDGMRMAKAFAPVLADAGIAGSYVIPLKAVEEMINMLDDNDEKAVIHLAPDKIALDFGSLLLVTRIFTGQFPDVDQVIPTKFAHLLNIHREELMTLLRQISLFASGTNSVRLTFETGQLHISSMKSEIGEGQVSMPVDYLGPSFDVAFNPFLFVDILRHSRDETVRIGLNEAHNPALITDLSQAQYILMPMRLNESKKPLTSETLNQT